MAVQKMAITLDDLMQMEQRVELINWERVEMTAAGGEHQLVGRNVFRILDVYVEKMGIGEVFQDGLTYLMFSSSAGLRDSFVPDVSFIHKDNIPADWHVEKPHPGVPDLAIEVISPGDNADMVQAKVRTYLDNGAVQVWLLYPRTKEMHQYINGDPETVRIYKGSQTIDAEALFPGIVGLTTDAIFSLPEWAIKGDDEEE